MLAGAACAALMGLALPTSAAALPYSPVPAQGSGTSAERAVTTFYTHRNGASLWFAKGDSSGARELIATLRRASLDGMPSGPALASQAERLIVRANAGDAAALDAADRMLSTAWVLYVQNLQRTPQGMTVADGWAAPRAQPALEILQRAALARSLASHVRSVSAVNPIYAQLREAAWQQMPWGGGTPDPRVLGNLARARAMPFQDRYIMVDAGSARLWMVENDRIVDSMKVIVGKPSTQTPMLASTIYRATLNPYWNVPQDMVQRLIAPRVIDQGVGYLKSHGYQVLSSYGDNAELIDAAKVDWRAVAAGREVVKVRQLPGPGNSMGQVKFSFPNSDDIFLHDTPKKELFASADRDVSNGCIRLEDAQRLSHWLFGRQVAAPSADPEQVVELPRPVPVYVTYFTAAPGERGIVFRDDGYGRDAALLAQLGGPTEFAAQE
jgi:L,D-transpeptidase YcbB